MIDGEHAFLIMVIKIISELSSENFANPLSVSATEVNLTILVFLMLAYLQMSFAQLVYCHAPLQCYLWEFYLHLHLTYQIAHRLIWPHYFVQSIMYFIVPSCPLVNLSFVSIWILTESEFVNLLAVYLFFLCFLFWFFYS